MKQYKEIVIPNWVLSFFREQINFCNENYDIVLMNNFCDVGKAYEKFKQNKVLTTEEKKSLEAQLLWSLMKDCEHFPKYFHSMDMFVD